MDDVRDMRCLGTFVVSIVGDEGIVFLQKSDEFRGGFACSFKISTRVLDLTQSLRLRTTDVFNSWVNGKNFYQSYKGT